MTHYEKAMKIFDDKFNCAQAVFGAFAEELGMSEEQALDVALCFSGGMRRGETCGAVSGGLMVFGLKYGEPGPEEDEQEVKMKAYSLASKFMERFQQENGSCDCKDLLGCNPSTEEGMQYAMENNLFFDICPKKIESAVRILEELLQ